MHYEGFQRYHVENKVDSCNVSASMGGLSDMRVRSNGDEIGRGVGSDMKTQSPLLQLLPSCPLCLGRLDENISGCTISSTISFSYCVGVMLLFMFSPGGVA